MVRPEERLSTLAARFASLERSINERFDEVCRRLDNRRFWLIALTGLAGAQLAATVALAIVMSRLSR
jgi:hypothetical protein